MSPSELLATFSEGGPYELRSPAARSSLAVWIGLFLSEHNIRKLDRMIDSLAKILLESDIVWCSNIKNAAAEGELEWNADGWAPFVIGGETETAIFFRAGAYRLMLPKSYLGTDNRLASVRIKDSTGSNWRRGISPSNAPLLENHQRRNQREQVESLHLPPIVISQTRRGAAPELSVVIWLGASSFCRESYTKPLIGGLPSQLRAVGRITNKIDDSGRNVAVSMRGASRVDTLTRRNLGRNRTN